MQKILIILLIMLPLTLHAQLTNLDYVKQTPDSTIKNKYMGAYCAHCAGLRWSEVLLANAKKQVGMYPTYDAAEQKLTRWGQQVSNDGCCIDVLLRAWQDMVHNMHRDTILSDIHWQPELKGLGISHMGLDYIYYRWRTQNGLDKSAWIKDGGRNLAHRRCRNIIQLFRNRVIPCMKMEGPTEGAIIFFKTYSGQVWHVGIAIDDEKMIHNIGGGVEIAPINNCGDYEVYCLGDLTNKYYDFTAK